MILRGQNNPNNSPNGLEGGETLTKPEEIEDEDEIIELEDEEQRLEELSSKTKAELKEIAKEYGLTGISRLNKDELIETIIEAIGIKAERLSNFISFTSDIYI